MKSTFDSGPQSTSTSDAESPASALSPGERIKTLVILGASGDLTGRLLLPGVAKLIASGRAPGLKLVGAGNDAWPAQQWQDRLTESFADALAPGGVSTADGIAELKSVQADSTYHQLDVTAKGVLGTFLKTVEGPVALYFALPPAVSQKACEILSTEDLPAGTRLVMEKPFGSSTESAQDLNATLAKLVPEDHIHRVDHFLGKSTVLNIMGLRFANRLLEHSWNRDHIEKVEIVFDEPLTLENRARYYDHAGAGRDMIQSHLLQIMAIMAMEPPATLDEEDVRSNIAAVLRASNVGEGADLERYTRRARYTAGTIADRAVPNYLDEEGVDPANGTETLAEVEVFVSNWRWAGVPFILRSGKALGRARKEAVVTFKPVPHLPLGFKGTDSPTRLHIGFGPETLTLDLDVNGPGDLFTLDRVQLQASLASDPLLPYGEVLDGVLSADPLLSVRGDTAEECWRIVEPTFAAWKANEVPLEDYPAGSLGPDNWSTSNDES
ncbi:glucose-6-phosphate dehydrogenase [Arthrobacter psychrolactophilus]|uniref:Glucose-6-phosphate 1-dehydrogenase n=1 Tax=Arthrobacter psychrolactophilus TaxID=92442 RepID=A0A2V5JEY5_9MICC|nr:glucose-6-phosphate dehydrogenase [Arthrobacter psychrolactophilus]PYI38007.1 glucose-6-phosphate dehydrogenase [Arthrobacter psychrolactophilus]